jgi:hypothetical protein
VQPSCSLHEIPAATHEFTPPTPAVCDSNDIYDHHAVMSTANGAAARAFARPDISGVPSDIAEGWRGNDFRAAARSPTTSCKHAALLAQYVREIVAPCVLS